MSALGALAQCFIAPLGNFESSASTFTLCTSFWELVPVSLVTGIVEGFALLQDVHASPFWDQEERWWRRRGLNPRPTMLSERHLRVCLIINQVSMA